MLRVLDEAVDEQSQVALSDSVAGFNDKNVFGIDLGLLPIVVHFMLHVWGKLRETSRSLINPA